jgi:hypothetical protein
MKLPSSSPKDLKPEMKKKTLREIDLSPKLAVKETEIN